ncbi:MAG TPA: hypothetical protein VHZ07_22760 [Bryobacteraceae bacterium]|jgi:hypothetical protein|nr:hypothetical protein [Bryobacteraceae bacterium]
MHKHSIILVLAVCAAAAQTDQNFTVGGTPVHLGEDQAAVLSRLRQTYQVQSSGTDSYSVSEKNAPALREIGLVTFKNAHLTSAGATWAETFSSDGVRFAKELVAAIGNQEIAGPRTVILRPIQSVNDGVVRTGFELLIGDRTIDVLTSQAAENGKASAKYATVMETLHTAAYVTAIQHNAAAK